MFHNKEKCTDTPHPLHTHTYTHTHTHTHTHTRTHTQNKDIPHANTSTYVFLLIHFLAADKREKQKQEQNVLISFPFKQIKGVCQQYLSPFLLGSFIDARTPFNIKICVYKDLSCCVFLHVILCYDLVAKSVTHSKGRYSLRLECVLR